MYAQTDRQTDGQTDTILLTIWLTKTMLFKTFYETDLNLKGVYNLYPWSGIHKNVALSNLPKNGWVVVLQKCA